MALNIYVVDDHQLFAEALKSVMVLLKRDHQVTIFTQPILALNSLKDNPPDLALIDLQMPGKNGFELLAEILTVVPSCAVIIISASLDKKDMQQALQAGAVGYITKSTSPKVMLSAVRLVLTGGTYVPPELVNVVNPMPLLNSIQTTPLTNNTERKKEKKLVKGLTERQHEVLVLLAKGKSNKQIARLIGCADTTVKAHLSAIFRALGVSNRTEAAITFRAGIS